MMRRSPSSLPGSGRRSGAAAVEAAFLVPTLVLFMIIAVDWSRVFYVAVTIDSAARNGAMVASGMAYQKNMTSGSGVTYSSSQRQSDGQAAAVNDGASLNPALANSNVTITVNSASTATYTVSGATYTVNLNTVTSTVTYNFSPFSTVLPIDWTTNSANSLGSLTLTRTVTMDELP
jgi:hypothetical protein